MSRMQKHLGKLERTLKLIFLALGITSTSRHSGVLAEPEPSRPSSWKFVTMEDGQLLPWKFSATESKPCDKAHEGLGELYETDDDKTILEFWEDCSTDASRKQQEKYGVPLVEGSFSGLWDEDCPIHVRDLLSFMSRYSRPIRIVVEPGLKDKDAHYWKVTYEWLGWDGVRGWIPLRELIEKEKVE